MVRNVADGESLEVDKAEHRLLFIVEHFECTQSIVCFAVGFSAYYVPADSQDRSAVGLAQQPATRIAGLVVGSSAEARTDDVGRQHFVFNDREAE